MEKKRCKFCGIDFIPDIYHPNTICCGNKECKKIQGRIAYQKWYEDNGKKIREKWKKENADRVKKIRKENYEANKERELFRNSEWRRSNKEKMRKYCKKYNKTLKGKINRSRKSARRRSLLKLTKCTLTAKEWNDILKKYKYRCYYCKCRLNNNNPPTQDHVIPLSKGGEHTKENIVSSCGICNSKKGSKML